MLVAGLGVANPPSGESLDVLPAVVAVVHVNGAVEHDEHLRAVVHVPDVWLVGPVKPNRGAVDLGNVERPPRAVRRKGASVDEFHRANLSRPGKIATLAVSGRTG